MREKEKLEEATHLSDMKNPNLNRNKVFEIIIKFPRFFNKFYGIWNLYPLHLSEGNQSLI